MKIWVGGYTKRESVGIYRADFDEEKQQVKQFEPQVKIGGPTYFQFDEQLGLLFSIVNENGQGGINSYKLVNGTYQLANQQLHDGSSPAYLGINQAKRLLYTANYHLGNLSVFAYDEQGMMTLLASVHHENVNLGPRKEQADSAHPHFFDETPAGNLVSCDLGQDQVDFYRLNEKHELIHLASYRNHAGFGTRHIRFSPDKQYFYVVGELASEINVVKFNEDTWTFEDLGYYSTIPATWTEHNGAAALYLSADGKFIYVSNRGHNSIAVFSVLDDHALRLSQRISVEGDFPRDFNWDQAQKFVLVANQNSDNATLFSRNSQTGMLSLVQKDIKVPEGTRVIFTD